MATDINLPSERHFYLSLYLTPISTIIFTHTYCCITTTSQRRHEFATLSIFFAAAGGAYDKKNWKSPLHFSKFVGNLNLDLVMKYIFRITRMIKISLIYCPNKNLINFSHTNRIFFCNPHSNQWTSKPPKTVPVHWRSGPLTQQCHKFPIGYNGLPISTSKIPFLEAISTPIYTANP